MAFDTPAVVSCDVCACGMWDVGVGRASDVMTSYGSRQEETEPFHCQQ